MGTAAKKSVVHTEIEQTFGAVPSWVRELPDATLEPVWGLMRDLLLAETKIPNKYKELIGLGVSGATRCRYCALFHTEAAKLYGATDEEIAEASMIAGMSMCISTFLNAEQIDYAKFQEETRQMVAFAKQQMAARGASPSKPSRGAQA
jgi:AhpD family alkylhydroperoxidase